MFEGGRGIVAAVLTSLGVAVFALSTNPAAGLINVILAFSCATFIAAVFVWLAVPDDYASGTGEARPASSAAMARPTWSDVLCNARAWMIAAVVFVAYWLYLGTYDFPAYAERGFGESKLFGAQLAAFLDWMRPLAAVAAGLIADRFRTSRVVAAAFLLLIAAYGSVTLLPADADRIWVLWLQVGTAALAGFALRATYFALLQETRIPVSHTGMTVGFISVIGYAPDLFAHTLAALFVDAYGVSAGYRAFYGMMCGLAALGLAVSLMLASGQNEQHRAA